MLAMFLTFEYVGSLNWVELNDTAQELSSATVSAVALLLFVGAIGKSAQLPPLHLVAGRDGRPDTCIRADPRRRWSPLACMC